MAPPETAHKSMKLKLDTVAAETAQITDSQAVVHERLVLGSWVLQERNHDRYTQEWGEWEDVEGRKLREKFGETPDEWKRACKMWIEVGGRYEFRIFKRVDAEEWSMCFSSENDQILPTCATGGSIEEIKS